MIVKVPALNHLELKLPKRLCKQEMKLKFPKGNIFLSPHQLDQEKATDINRGTTCRASTM